MTFYLLKEVKLKRFYGVISIEKLLPDTFYRKVSPFIN